MRSRRESEMSRGALVLLYSLSTRTPKPNPNSKHTALFKHEVDALYGITCMLDAVTCGMMRERSAVESRDAM